MRPGVASAIDGRTAYFDCELRASTDQTSPQATCGALSAALTASLFKLSRIPVGRGDSILRVCGVREASNRMRRLALLLLACLLLTSGARGEERVWRLGVLTTGDWPTSTLRTVMVPELARRGFAEGRNLVVLPRWGSGNDDEALAQAARALADAKSDVIVAVSLPAVRAALRAAPDTPIVASFIDDPIRDKLATSLARPSGTVTGIAVLASEGDKKRLELLRDAIPAARRFGYLASPSTVSSLASMKQTASLLGVEIIGVEASDGSEYRAAFDVLRDARVDGVIIASSPVFYRDAAPLAALATERRMATVCEWREMADAGCLIGYGPNLDELRARTADFVVRLFAGRKVSDMPFEQPTHLTSRPLAPSAWSCPQRSSRAPTR